jgi:hypothetical protein
MNLHDYDWSRLAALGYPEDFAEKMKDDPCWKGYQMVGMKPGKGGKVPNCVPLESKHAEEMKRKPMIAGPSAGSPSM